MNINLNKAHKDQLTVVDGKKKLIPRPEFILDTGESVTDIRNHPGIIVFENDTEFANEENLSYRVECHAAMNDKYHSDIAEYIEVQDTKTKALERASELLGEKIPTAEKGIINEIDITAFLNVD